MFRSHRFGAMIKSGISQQSSLTVCAHAVLRCCAVETSAGSLLSIYKEYEICLLKEIYCGIRLPKIIKIELGLTKLLQKKVLLTHVVVYVDN